MLFITAALLSYLSVFTTALAAPLDGRNAATEYYLKTCVVKGPEDTGSPKDGLYVSAYHTGAGLNDAILAANISIASKGFLNGTNQQFDFDTSFPWGMVLGVDVNYAGWEPVEINVGTGSEGFFINSTGLQGPADLSFGGWLACDWWHGLPQLFYLVAGYEQYQVIPSSCSRVELEVVDI